MNQKDNHRLKKRILHKTGSAIFDFNMIQENDRILVCLSGGKDSWTLLDMLLFLRKKSPIKYDIVALNVHPGFESFQSQKIFDHCNSIQVPIHIERTVINKIIARKIRPGTSYCSFCARLRRGAIYEAAKRIKVSKIALGHHRDDLNETILMNMFYSGILKSMSPKMRSDNGEHVLTQAINIC